MLEWWFHIIYLPTWTWALGESWWPLFSLGFGSLALEIICINPEIIEMSVINDCFTFLQYRVWYASNFYSIYGIRLCTWPQVAAQESALTLNMLWNFRINRIRLGLEKYFFECYIISSNLFRHLNQGGLSSLDDISFNNQALFSWCKPW